MTRAGAGDGPPPAVPDRGAPLTLVLATANPGKVAEIVAIVADVVGDAIGLRPRPASVPPVEETGQTLEENALLKARALVEATGMAAVADDTGLEVDALGGAPGVSSARYAGEEANDDDNVTKLLAALASETDEEGRRARFRTVAVACFPGGRRVVADGVIEGHIAPERRGGGGFGYDPVFVPSDGDGRTLAEMTPSEKNALSHRGRAFRALAVGLVSGP